MSDRLLRSGAAAAVLLVAFIAAVISFVHIQHLALTHGQTAMAAALLPLSIDGAVTASSLVLLRAARAQIPAPLLAQFMLGLSVLATLAANVAYGAAYGVTGALISGWPAVAFIGCAEMAITMARRARTAAPVAAPAALANGHSAPEGAREAAERYAASLSRGELPSVRQVRREMHLGQPRAQEVRAYLETLTRTP